MITLPLRRPVVRYFGGKWRMAPWIIGHFPRRHHTYVEPFGGGGSVLLRKPRSHNEVYNDVDGDVVNLFRVLREQSTAEELRRQLSLTPFSRDEYLACFSPERDSSAVERARRTLVRSFMGIGSNAVLDDKPHGFRSKRKGGSYPSHDWANYPLVIQAYCSRLSGVTIENRNALVLMREHDHPDTLFYCDPPYLPCTREPHTKGYRFEMSETDHLELLQYLKGVQGYVVLSGYDNALYRDTLVGWTHSEKACLAGKAIKREILWLSPRTSETLTGTKNQ